MHPGAEQPRGAGRVLGVAGGWLAVRGGVAGLRRAPPRRPGLPSAAAVSRHPHSPPRLGTTSARVAAGRRRASWAPCVLAECIKAAARRTRHTSLTRLTRHRARQGCV